MFTPYVCIYSSLGNISFFSINEGDGDLTLLSGAIMQLCSCMPAYLHEWRQTGG